MGNSCGGNVLRTGGNEGGRRNVSALAFDDKWEGEKKKERKKERKGARKGEGRDNGDIYIYVYGRRVQYRESMFF